MSSEQEKDTRTRILEATWHLLEQNQGYGVKMSDIARAVGISRQAVYLHFPSRNELMIATMTYVDEVQGLNQRMSELHNLKQGIELLEGCIEVWCNYIPEIYGLARAMLLTRDTDEAMAAAWENGMGCLREVCKKSVQILHQEGKLSGKWSIDQATDIFVTLISIQTWEQLVKECHWSQEEYTSKVAGLVKDALLNH